MGIFGRKKKREKKNNKKDVNTSEPNWTAESAAQLQEATQAAWRHAVGFHCPGAGWNLSPPVKLQEPRCGLENASTDFINAVKKKK